MMSVQYKERAYGPYSEFNQMFKISILADVSFCVSTASTW